MAHIPAEIAEAGVKRLLAELSAAIDEIKELENNMEKLKGATDALQDRKKELKNRYDDLKNRSLKRTGKYITWLKNIRKVRARVDRMYKQFDGMLGCMGPAYRLNVFLSHRLSIQSKEWLAVAEKYEKESHKFTDADLLMDRGPGVVAERPGGAVIGSEKAYEKLKEHLRDNDVSIVVINGIGGIGKSKLLDRLNREIAQSNRWKEEEEEDDDDNKKDEEVVVEEDEVMVEVELPSFDCVIWIDAGGLRGEEEVQMAVAEEMRIAAPQAKKTRNEIAADIYDKVKQKKYLVVLNNVWTPVDLTKVGLPSHKSKSKTILTTRMPNVCKSLGARKLKMEGLESMEAWCLFKMSAEWDRIQKDPILEEILEPHAKELVESCGGLPGALVTVGQAMSHKDDERQWKNAITELSRVPWMIPGMTENVLEQLKVSYDRLGTEKNLELSCEQKRAMQLKKCFLYCSLYPEGFSIHKEWIVDYCIGEGIIDDAFLEVEEIYNKGHSLIGDLVEASLLERGDDRDHVKMHPMVRAMALWIACEQGVRPNRWLVPLHKENRKGKSNQGIGRAPDDEIWTEAERISLMRSNILNLPDSPTCPDLLTLLLQSNDKLEKIPKRFFHFMPILRVLDLSHTGIKAIPDGIGELPELQYLDLCKTKISSLPEQLGKLSKLRFLLLAKTHQLRTIPPVVISELSELRVLYIEYSYGDWRVDSADISNTTSSQQSGVNFKELEKLKRLKVLGITVKTHAALDKLVKCKRLCQSTRKLHIDGSKASEENKDSHLSDFDKCGDVLISDDLPNLTFLHLKELGKVRSAWKGHCLQNLCELMIVDCERMEQLVFCDDMEIKEEEGNGAINTLPHLRKMYLIRLPEMKSLSNGRRPLYFRALDYLHVSKCPKLERLTMAVKKHGKILSEVSWWQGLEWECKQWWEFESLKK